MPRALPGLRSHTFRPGCGLLLCALVTGMRLCIAAGSVAAAEVDCQVGFGGVFQVGRWTHIALRPEGAAAAATVQAVDVDGRPVTFPLARQADGTWAGLFQSGRLDAPLRVTWTGPGGDVTERVIPVGGESSVQNVRQTTQLWMAVGPHTGFQLGAELLNATTPDTGRGRPVQLLPTDAADLPTGADALGSLRLLVLGTPEISPEQSTAVREWVQRGGRLVLLIGSASEPFRASPLAAWLPVTIEPAYIERQTAALTSNTTAYVPGKGILRSLDPLQVARLGVASGVVLINGPTAPVAVRCAYGLGTVTAVGLDLEAPPFITASGGPPGTSGLHWGGLPLMCVQLAGEELPPPGASSGERQLQLAPTGVSDMASQLGGILDHFPSVQRSSNWNVIGLLGLYLLLVGPLDYLLVHRLLGRPQLTWITLPVWVLLASWWATGMAEADNGAAVESRQIDVLDVAADTGVQRTMSWFSLYSPQTRRHDVEWRPRSTAPEGATLAALAAFARPEEGFRGLYRRGGINLGGAGYELAPSRESAAAHHTPVDQWSSLVFASEACTLPAAADPPVATCRQVIDSEGALRRFELTHHLPGELTDWFVVQRLEVTFPMPGGPAPLRLAPGVPCDLTRGCGLKLLKAFVQGQLTTTVKRKTGEDVYVRADEYNPLGLDAKSWFRALSFYDAIGGAEYTRLTNQSLDRLDWSSYVHLDRIVVCGRLAQAASSYTVDGTPAQPRETDTFVRLLIPIERESSTLPSLSDTEVVRDAAAPSSLAEGPAS